MNKTGERPSLPIFPSSEPPRAPLVLLLSHWPHRSLAGICTCPSWTVCELSSVVVLGPRVQPWAGHAVGCIVSHQALLPTPELEFTEQCEHQQKQGWPPLTERWRAYGVPVCRAPGPCAPPL